MMKFNIFYLFALSLLLCECSNYQPDDKSKIVIEGWIDYDSYPVVILTQTVPISKKKSDVDDLKNYVVKWAKVSISDGEKSVILTGKYDERFYPPYIYTTADMKGELDKDYTLKVEYEDFCATATTHIEKPEDVDSFHVVPISEDNNYYEIRAFTHKSNIAGDCYKYFTKTKGYDLCFRTSYLGTINSDFYKDTIQTLLYKSRQLSGRDYVPYFQRQDTVYIKYTHIDSQAYEFWNKYCKLLSLSKNVFTSYSESLPTNIKGGIGLWAGYGAKYYEIDINKAIKNGGTIKIYNSLVENRP